MHSFIRITTWLSLFAFFFSQCKTIGLQELQANGALQQRLPKLIPSFQVYPTPIQPQAVLVFVDSAIRQPILLPPVLDSTEIRGIRSSYYQDRNASELEIFFARDVEKNMVEHSGSAQGYITCTITALEQSPDIFPVGLKVLHSLTAFGTAFIGVPIAKSVTEIELQVSIWNKKGELVTTYGAIGKDRKRTGFYYGYHLSQIRRANVLDACEDALKTIKEQISRDQAQLRQKL